MKSTFLPPAKEFWGKVIFPEAYVSHSVQRDCAWQGEACVAKDVHGRGACVRACVAGGHAWQVHACTVGEACVAGAVHGREGRRGTCAGEMATEAGGTHPTGMNSCLNKNRFLKK